MSRPDDTDTADLLRRLESDPADLIRRLRSEDPDERESALSDLTRLLPIMQHLAEQRLGQQRQQEEDQR